MPSPTGGNLLHNLVLFGRLLRGLGMDVNPGRMLDLVAALEHVDIGRRSDFYYTLRSLLVHHRADLPRFDEAFDRFWRAPGDGSVTLGSLFSPAPPPPPKQILTLPQPDLAAQPPDDTPGAADEPAQELVEVTRTYSQREILWTKDFGQMSAAELQAVRQFMAELVWDLGLRRTRRRRGHPHGRLPDMRRLLRQNLRYGGELLEWPRRTPRFKPRPLIILADISGSMEQYTRLLLQFTFSLSSRLAQQVEVFVFSTRLTRITRQLRTKNLDEALTNVASEVHDWAGGTRIGDALKTFNFKWGRRVLGRGAVVMLISDGWDRGDPQLLRAEMGRLHRSCHRLIWLNPLLGSPRYEPLTRGMQAALPFIDDFLPVHNLASLADLSQHLASLTAEKRPSRRPKLTLTGAAFVNKIR
ncbi:MAG: VWA domain-containing protein [Anaerolineales bacterium]|nr:VWA domain-containing protein [Anaerolineales bacterium]